MLLLECRRVFWRIFFRFACTRRFKKGTRLPRKSGSLQRSLSIRWIGEFLNNAIARELKFRSKSTCSVARLTRTYKGYALLVSPRGQLRLMEGLTCVRLRR